MVSTYAKKFSGGIGAKVIKPRQVIGAFIIKHILSLSGGEIFEIRGNKIPVILLVISMMKASTGR
jgi:hypothetical protein